MTRGFASDRSWRFDAPRVDLWERLSDVEQYHRWWPWLRRFDPDRGFTVDSRWSCEVAPPLPYVVRFAVALERVEPGACASATIRGDIRGSAELTVDDDGDGSVARLRSELSPANPLLRRVAWLAPPIVQWGHDWVLDQGRRQFVERGMGGDAT